MSLDPATRRTHAAPEGRAHRRPRVRSRRTQSLWGIRQLNGLCTLVRIPKPYRDWTQIHTFPYGTIVYDLDVSPDGTRLAASFGEISGKQNVRVLSIDAIQRGDLTPVAQFDFGTAVPDNFVFSPDGRFLFGSSYYTGVSNIFRYEIATTKLDAVTNTDTGFFRPIPLDDDELIVFRYTGEGFVPARITATPLEDVSAITFLGERLVEEHPIVKTWNVGSPAKIPFDTMPTRDRRVSPGGRTLPRIALPDRAGLQGFARRRAAIQLLRSAAAESTRPDGELQPRHRAAIERTHPRRCRLRTVRLARARRC